ncbi:MAG: NADH-quinone oxidoreductase subunit M [Verrucomicrobiota bacterium]
MSSFPWLTLLTLLPLVGGIAVMGLGAADARRCRRMALAFCLGSAALVLGLWRAFDSTQGGFQFQESHVWVSQLGIHYLLGLDGLGLVMVLLTALVVPMGIAASTGLFESPKPGASPSLYYGLVLLLQSGLFGTFTALNFFHWFLFWELSLIPAFFLVRLWGGPRRAAAATQFFVYTMFGSVCLLLTFLALVLATGHVSDFPALAEWSRDGRLFGAISTNLGFGLSARAAASLLFAGALIGLAVKVPLMPFHTWLPAAYTEAPSATTMLLTGLMSKMGVYGFLRILLPIFAPELHWFRTPLLALAVITVVFSACAAFAQRDLKRVLAYSSVNHLGYCLVAIFAVATPAPGVDAAPLQQAAALNGVILQMFNHGLTAATLFWFVALLEQRSGGLRGLDDFGGLRKVVPVFSGLMGIAWFSSLGLPGLNGFVGEFLVFKGVFPLALCSASISVLGLLVTAVVILTVIQRVFQGPVNERWAAMPDLTLRERVQLSVPIALMFVLGVWPQLLLGPVNATVTALVAQLRF